MKEITSFDLKYYHDGAIHLVKTYLEIQPKKGLCPSSHETIVLTPDEIPQLIEILKKYGK